jgi:hypothetical protein
VTRSDRPTVVIERPVSEVFPFIADLNNAPKWAPQMGPIVGQSGPMAEGLSFGELRTVLGRRSIARWTVSQLVPEKVIGFSLRWGPLSGEFAYHFEPAGPSSTRITQDIAFRLWGPLSPLSGMVTSEATKEEARELVRLKELLEAPRG